MPENEKRPEKGEVRQYTVAEDDEGVRLDRWFKRHLPEVGFATVARWARTGQIRVDGARAKPDDRLTTGQVLRIPPGNPARAKAPPRRRELTEDQKAQARAMVIKETPNAIVLNKPPGLATQGGSKTFSHVDGLLDAFVEGDGPRPRLVHRLDKDTSGVLLIARPVARLLSASGSPGAAPRRSIGRWWSACPNSTWVRSTPHSPSSRAPAARRCMSTRKADSRPRPATAW